MYGKLDNNGEISIYNGFFIESGDMIITNPKEEDLKEAGYKPIEPNGYIIRVTDSKISVRYTDMGDFILMEHITEDGYMGEPEEEY